MNKELIQRLINCDISWNEFSSITNCGSYLIEIENTIIKVDNKIVSKAIQACIDTKYTMQDLLDWANVVRFSDIFLIEEEYSDCVISILDRIEESDEEGCELTKEDLLSMIDKLNKNEEW